MSIFVKNDYTVANGFLPLTHARILHKGNWHEVDAITASSASGLLPAEAADNTLTIDRWTPASLPATWAVNFGAARDVDCVCIGAHVLAGCAVTVEAFVGGVWTTVHAGDVTDNSPIMFLFDTVNAQEFRLNIAFDGSISVEFTPADYYAPGATTPYVGVVKFGQALQMARPFYAGASPAPMNRQTDVIGNISGTGELLGRSNKQTILTANYSWQNLPYDWVRANLDGRKGLIQAAEKNPLFVAWRPALAGDVDFVMRASAGSPQAQGVRNLWSFQLSGESYSYE